VLYFSTITWAPSIAIFLIAQVLRVIDIGFIDYQGISYIQVLMPDRVASAATLFSNTANAGSLFAGHRCWRMGDEQPLPHLPHLIFPRSVASNRCPSRFVVVP